MLVTPNDFTGARARSLVARNLDTPLLLQGHLRRMRHMIAFSPQHHNKLACSISTYVYNKLWKNIKNIFYFT